MLIALTIALLFSCAARPATTPPTLIRASAPAATATLERGWPEVAVPAWEPRLDELIAADASLEGQLKRLEPATLTEALEALEQTLSDADCPANAEAPELEEAAMALEQGRLVLELGALDMVPDMLTLVDWMQTNLEAPVRACVTQRRLSSVD